MNDTTVHHNATTAPPRTRTILAHSWKAAAIALACAVVGLLIRSIIVPNLTPSEPMGYYLLMPNLALHVGDTVFVCAPKRALDLAPSYHADLSAGASWPYCPSTELLTKTVWGVPGDHLDISAAGIVRNGTRIPDSSSALLVFPAHIDVAPGTIFVGSIFPFSFDSRIFGTVRPFARALPIAIQHDWTERVRQYRRLHHLP